MSQNDPSRDLLVRKLDNGYLVGFYGYGLCMEYFAKDLAGVIKSVELLFERSEKLRQNSGKPRAYEEEEN